MQGLAPLWRRSLRLAAGPASRRAFSQCVPLSDSYGFIGLGRMGLPMAQNLRAKIKPDDTLIVYDVVQSSTKALLEAVKGTNTTVAASAREVAENSATVITSLPEPHHVQAVMGSIFDSALPKAEASRSRLFIDCSTIDTVTSRAIARQIHETTGGAAAFVDAPMSGGVVGAEAGTLTFMLGSPADLVERATAVLEKMGKRIVHLGDQGAGLAGKLANNYLLALNNIATAEAMSMGVQWGLDPKALAGMMNTATGRCWPSEVNNPVPGVSPNAPPSRGYEGGFGIALMKKDLRLALSSVREFGIKNAMGERAMEVYEQASQDPRCKGKDFASVYRWLDGPEK